ncbi:putative uncharacterized protein DDB_G0282133 [Patella vulgata]|uniref:putative uncharacterized protein DDB_G0282133 n=1 Tax=Patella vulgata TaxID=6465 RepID=UPI0024A7B71C|nr:putative uncharacterized protein DDB_G0282133 [Patella vulgata]
MTEYFSKSDRYREDLRRNLPDLIKQIPTKEILPHLRCLSDSDMEKYTKQLERESEAHVNTDLLLKLPKCEYWFRHLKDALFTLERYHIIDLLNWWDMEDGGSDRRTSAANQPTVSPSFNQRRGDEERYFTNNGRGRGGGGVGYNKILKRRGGESVDRHERTSSLDSRRANNSGEFQYQKNDLSCTGLPNIPVTHDTDGERLDRHERASSLDSRRANNSTEFQYQEPVSNITNNNWSVDDNVVTTKNHSRTSVEIQQQKLDSYSKQNKIQKSIQNSSVELRNMNPHDNLPVNSSQNSDNESVELRSTDLSRDNINLDKSGYVKELIKSTLKNPYLIHNSKGERQQEDNGSKYTFQCRDIAEIPNNPSNINSSQNFNNESVEISTDVSRDNMNLEKSGYVKELVKSALKNPELIHNSKGDRQREDNGFQTRGNCSVVNTEDQKKNINSDRLIKQITKELKQQHDAYQENEEKPFLNPDSEITDQIRENQTNQSQLNLYEDNSGDIRENVTSLTTTTNTGCSPPKANLPRRGIPEIPNNPNNTSCMGMNGNGGHFTSFGGSTCNALNTSSTTDLQNEPSREVAVFRNNQALPNNHIDATNRGVYNVAQPSSTAHSINSGANTPSCASTIDQLNRPRSEIVVSQIQNNTPTTELEVPPGNEVDVSQTTANNNEVSFNTRSAINGATYDNAMFSTLSSPNSFYNKLVSTSSSTINFQGEVVVTSQDTTSGIGTVITSTTTDIQDKPAVINGRLHDTGVSLATVVSQTASNSAQIPSGTNTDEYSSRESANTTSTVDPTGVSDRGRIRNELRISGMVDGGTDESSTFSGVSNYQTLSNDLNLSGPSTASTVDPTGLSRRGRLRNEIRITDTADGQNGDTDRIRENESTTRSNPFDNEQCEETSENEVNASVLSSEYPMNFEDEENTGVSSATVDSQTASNAAQIPNDTNTDDYSSRESARTTSTVDPTGVSERGWIRNELRISGMADGVTDESSTFSGVSNYQTLSNDLNLSGPSTASTVDPTGLSRRGRLRNEIRITDTADEQNGDTDRIRQNESTTRSNPFDNEQCEETSETEVNAPVLSSEYPMNFEDEENTGVSSATVDSQTASNAAQIPNDTNTDDYSSRESARTTSTVDPTGVSERGWIRNELRISGMADGVTDESSTFSGVSNYQTLSNDLNLSGPSTASTVDPTGLSRRGRLRNEIRITDTADEQNGDTDRIRQNESTTRSNPFDNEQCEETSETEVNAPVLSSEYPMNFEDEENTGVSSATVDSQTASNAAQIPNDTNTDDYSSRESARTTSTVDPTGVSERGWIRNELRISGMADGVTDESSTFSGVSNYQTLSNDLNLSGPSTASTVDPTGLSRRGRLRNEIRITGTADEQNGDTDRIRQNESTTQSNPFGDEQSNETSEIEAYAPEFSSEYPMNFEDEENRGATFDLVQSFHPPDSLSLASRVDSSPFNIEPQENRETTSRSVLSDDSQGFNQEDEGINEHFSTQEDQPLTVPEAGWLSSLNVFPSLSEIMSYALDR